MQVYRRMRTSNSVNVKASYQKLSTESKERYEERSFQVSNAHCYQHDILSNPKFKRLQRLKIAKDGFFFWVL